MKWVQRILGQKSDASQQSVSSPEELLARLKEFGDAVSKHHVALGGDSQHTGLLADLPLVDDYDSAYNIYQDTYANAYFSTVTNTYLLATAINDGDADSIKKWVSELARLDSKLDSVVGKPAYEGETKRNAMSRTLDALEEAVQHFDNPHKDEALKHVAGLRESFAQCGELVQEFKKLSEHYDAQSQSGGRGA